MPVTDIKGRGREKEAGFQRLSFGKQQGDTAGIFPHCLEVLTEGLLCPVFTLLCNVMCEAMPHTFLRHFLKCAKLVPEP